LDSENNGGAGKRGRIVYTFLYTNLNPLNGTGFERQAPEGMIPSDIDSIQGPNSYSETTRADTDYQTSFMSEVFHEVENILDVSKKDAGTPLTWSFTKNTVVSAATDKTLSQMRTNLKPMFGDPNDVCPMNIIEVPTGTSTTTTTETGGTLGSISLLRDLRNFRDGYLMDSKIVVACVDIYYTFAPMISKVILKSENMRYLFAKTIYGSVWLVKNSLWKCLLGIFMIIWLWRRVKKMRVSRTKTTMLLFLLCLFLLTAFNADARIAFLTTEDLISLSNAVVSGEVVATNSYMEKNMRIYTDIEFKVDEVIKGSVNENSSVIFTIPGGRVNGYAMVCSEMPEFKIGDKSVIYLRQLKSGKYTLYAGTRSVTLITEDTNTGKKYVKPYAEYDNIFYTEDQKAITSKSSVQNNASSNGLIPLENYIQYLKDLAGHQR
jgi:hypothetical protein